MSPKINSPLSKMTQSKCKEARVDEARGTILIVDDSRRIRFRASRRLQAERYDCITAADAEKALQETATHDFDLVLLDIELPGISGVDILPQIIGDHPDTVVVMMSETAHIQTAVEALDLGACDYVTKPFDLDDLSLRVDEALERKRLISRKKKVSASPAS